MPSNPMRGQWEHTPLGKILRAIGTGERLGTRALLQPLAGMIDPSAGRRLERLQGDVYAGDVLEALAPMGKYASPLEKAGKAFGGMVLGGLVDPLSYIGIGRPAKVLKGALKGAGAATKAARAAGRARGGLLRAKVPFTSREIPLMPERASQALVQAGQAIQRGHAGEQLLQRVGLPQVGRFWDTLTVSVGQKFGVQVGADPWLMRTHQELFSKITGVGRLRAGQVVDELEPFLQEASRRFANQLDLDPSDAYTRLKAAVTEATDAHPYIVAAKTAKAQRMAFEVIPYRDEYSKARDAVISNFGLPPSFGGPASPTDTDLIRQVRDLAIKRKRMASNILVQDEARLGHEMKLITHPDAGYSAGVMSTEAKGWIDKANWKAMRGMLVGGRGRVGRPYTRPPTEHIAHEIARTMRLVDPAGFDRFRRAGHLVPFTTTISRKGRRAIRTLNPERILEGEIGKPVSKVTRSLINRMVRAKTLSLDDKADNYVGYLIPSIPTLDKNRYIWENGWGIIPPGTIRNFFDTDPTVIDVVRGMRSDRAMLSKEWFDAVKTRPELVRAAGSPDIPNHWVEVKGIPELAGYHMAPDEAKFLSRHYETDINLGPRLKECMSVIRAMNQSFKSWTLSMFPSYHTRNAIGLGWNYYLGVESPGEAIANIHRSKSAWDAIRGGSKTSRAWILKGSMNPNTKKPYSAGEIWRAVEENHGWGVGFISPEDTGSVTRHVEYMKKYGIDDPERELLKGARQDWKLNGRKGKPFVGPPPPGVAEKIKLGLLGQHPVVERGFRIGTYVDDRVRMAHLLQKLREGESMEDAIRSMKKYFFDYHQLSPFERTWLKEAFPFYSWCCCEDTECLSKDGWKNFKDVSVGEEILAYKDGSLVWDSVEAVNVFDYRGEMIRIGSDNHRGRMFLFTPSHRCLVVDHNQEERMVPAYKLRSNHRLIRSGAYRWPDESILSSRDAAILGWLVTDGYHRWRGRHLEAMIYQSPQKHLTEIIKLLGDEGSARKPHPDSGVVPVTIKAVCTQRLKKVFRGKEDLPGIVSQLDEAAATAMWRAMVHAEGCVQDTFVHFGQLQGPVLDAFQMLSIMFGKTTDLSSHGAYIGSGRAIKVAGVLGVQQYTGRVWCPTTATGTWVARRKGKVVITGNSRKNIPFQLEMLVRRPDRIARLHGGLQGWEGAEEVPPEEKYLNSWMKRNFSVRMRRDKHGKWEYFAFRNWLPFVDIAEIFHGLEWMTQSLTPWARIPIEQIMNVNWFTDRKIDYMNDILRGERTRFGTFGRKGTGVAIPNRLAHILKSFRITNTLHQILDNPQELDFHTQFMRFVAGRVYPLDVGRSRYQFKKDLDHLESSARRSMRSAVFAGDDDAVQRLVESYLKKRKKLLKSRGM